MNSSNAATNNFLFYFTYGNFIGNVQQFSANNMNATFALLWLQDPGCFPPKPFPRVMANRSHISGGKLLDLSPENDYKLTFYICDFVDIEIFVKK